MKNLLIGIVIFMCILAPKEAARFGYTCYLKGLIKLEEVYYAIGEAYEEIDPQSKAVVSQPEELENN